jgi:hypothetical protein
MKITVEIDLAYYFSNPSSYKKVSTENFDKFIQPFVDRGAVLLGAQSRRIIVPSYSYPLVGIIENYDARDIMKNVAFRVADHYFVLDTKKEKAK